MIMKVLIQKKSWMILEEEKREGGPSHGALISSQQPEDKKNLRM